MKIQLALFFLLIKTAFAAEISYTPENARFDEQVSIEISGLQPESYYTLELHSDKSVQGFWKSSGNFSSSTDGRIHLDKSASLGGSYAGVDAMGLFWSLKWHATPSNYEIDYSLLTKLHLVVRDSLGGEVLSKDILRVSCQRDPNVQREVVDNGEIFATFYYPKQKGKNRTVLVLSGSEGGKREEVACMLASHGFTGVALAYFNYQSLPKNLVEIPLEYFERALSSISQHPRVDIHRLAVTGGSKGGELSLLLGSRYKQFRAVVAFVPSSFVWTGIDPTGSNLQSSWSKNGQGLPFVAYNATNIAFGNPPYALRPGFESALGNPKGLSPAAIPVENTNGPILFISGTDDQVWPSSSFSDMAVARLMALGFKHPFEHLRYEGAGHLITSSYFPATFETFGPMILGGKPEANARASKDSWPKVLKFLETNLY